MVINNHPNPLCSCALVLVNAHPVQTVIGDKRGAFLKLGFTDNLEYIFKKATQRLQLLKKRTHLNVRRAAFHYTASALLTCYRFLFWILFSSAQSTPSCRAL